jgi:hypothetical protein
MNDTALILRASPVVLGEHGEAVEPFGPGALVTPEPLHGLFHRLRRERYRDTSNELDTRMMAGCGGEAPVPCEHRDVERFRQSDIDGVIGREMVPQIPDPWQQKMVRIPVQGKVGKIGKSCPTTLPVDLAGRCIPPDDLRNFNIEQVGSVQRLSRLE